INVQLLQQLQPEWSRSTNLPTTTSEHPQKRNKSVDTTPCYKNDNHSGKFGNQRTVNVAGAREKVGSPQYDWLADTGEEVDEQELEAHYNYMVKIQEVPIADLGIDSEPVEQVQNDAGYNVFANGLQHSVQSESVSNTCLVETNDSNVILDSPYISILCPTAQDMEILIQTCLMPLAIKTHNDSFKFVHELKQEMHANLKYVESIEKEVDELESDKAEFSDMYDVILQECVSKYVMCSYLMSLSDLDALHELQCLYLHKVKECDCLAQKLSKQTESVSKKVHTELLQRFAKVEKHSISLEIALQKCKEQ
nr:hypothetical protein [Tanacetum cinerariifolium]